MLLLSRCITKYCGNLLVANQQFVLFETELILNKPYVNAFFSCLGIHFNICPKKWKTVIGLALDLKIHLFCMYKSRKSKTRKINTQWLVKNTQKVSALHTTFLLKTSTLLSWLASYLFTPSHFKSLQHIFLCVCASISPFDCCCLLF